MSQLACGRCGQYTAPNSTYCPNDRWAIFADISGFTAPGTNALDFELPHNSGSFLGRRRLEGHRDQVERSYRATLEQRLEALEKQLEKEQGNAEILRAMGLLALLEDQNERANGLFERAHQLFTQSGNPDFETQINYAIVLARRGQLQAAIGLLQDAQKRWPTAPLAHFNLALVALRARRPALVHEAVAELEKLWRENPAIAKDFHEEAISARGLAFLLEEKAEAALTELSAAARQAVDMGAAGNGKSEDNAESVLEGKTAEADLLNNLAVAEAQSGHLDRAIGRLKAALRLEPGHPQILNNLGVLAYQQGRSDVAARYLGVALQIEEALGAPDPVTLSHLGVVYSTRGQLDKALESFQRAGNLEHAEFEVFYNLGRAYIEHGRLDVGAAALRQAFAIEPNNADVHTVLGSAYLFSGKVNFYGEALKHLKRALQLDTHHRTAGYNLVLALMEIRNRDAARQLLQQVMKMFPNEAESRFLAALYTLDSITNDNNAENQFVSASQQFDHALAQRPEVAASLYNSALCQFIVGFRDQASKLLESAVARDSALGPAYFLIGLGHAVAKRDEEALAAWKMAGQYEPNNAELHANMGALFYRRKDFQSAIRSYMTAHRLLPQDAGILAALGVAFAQAQKYNQAITSLEQSIQIDPRSPITHSNLGLTYYLFKHVEAAMEHWRIVSQLDKAYSDKRGDDMQRSFDDSIVQLRPLNWRDRLVRMAPLLPRPRTRLVPGTNVREYRLAVTDDSLQPIVAARREVQRSNRALAWMNVKI